MNLVNALQEQQELTRFDTDYHHTFGVKHLCNIYQSLPCALSSLQHHSIQKDLQAQKRQQGHLCEPYPSSEKHQQNLQSLNAYQEFRYQENTICFTNIFQYNL